jgi:general secretion pathway protein D
MISLSSMKLGSLTLASLLLLGCAQQRIRDDASDKLREAEYEKAITALQNGVADYPESALLRTGLLQARTEAVSRLIAQALQERIEGRFDTAEQTILRAIKIDPNNARLTTLRLDLEQARRLQKNLDSIRNLINQGQRTAASALLQTALRDAPRNSELLYLQRQLELEQRLTVAGPRSLAETRPISLEFRNAALSSLLEAITRASGINFILDRDVRLDNRSTIFMKAGKVEDALDLILGANQLAKRIIDSQTILVYPNTAEKQREHQELVVRVFYLAHAEAKTTAQMLRSMIKVRDPYVDEKTNMLALRETPEVIAMAERLIALHDVGEPEVMLDLEILEVKTSRLTELGINFPNTFSLTPIAAGGSGSGGSGLTLDSLRNINSSQIGVSVAGLLFNLRREVGDFNTLANPKVRTRSKEKAKILIGDKVPVITTTNSGTTGLVSENISYLDVGLKLDAEPIVSPDDEVTIKLGLEVSSIVREIKSAGGSTAFQIGTRNANTVLRLQDGETQILAGLISRDDRSAANRVPGLGDLPIAGRLFSSQRDDYQRTELILAVTPRIVRPAPRPSLAQSELWIGSEVNTRLRPAPLVANAADATIAAPTVTPSRAASTPAALHSPTSPTTPVANSGTASAAAPSTSVSAVAPIIAAPQTTPQAASQTATASSAPSTLASPTSPSATANLAGIQLNWQAPKEVKVGDSFSITAAINSASSLRGIPAEVMFSPDLLEVVAIAEGEFLKQGDSATSFVQAVNPTAGRVNIGLMRNAGTGASGEGQVFTIQFKAKAAGTAKLTFSSVRLIGENGMLPTPSLPTASVVVR